MNPNPVVKAFLICDQVIQEVGTNKKSCIGIFLNINAPQVPLVHSAMSIYANLVDGQGAYTTNLTLLRQEDNAPIFNIRGPTIEFKDRFTTVELVMHLRGVPFEKYGKYEFQLSANEQLLQSKPFQVLPLKTSM